MRTSLNNIKVIDDYLSGRSLPGDALLFEANMLVNPGLANDVQQQQKAYAVIKQYSRKRLKAEIAAVQEKLAVEPQYQGFIQRIVNLFKNL